MAEHKFSISFRRQYKHIYEHLLRQTNRSDYVCRLIEADMNKKGQLSEDEIRKVVMEILGEQANRHWGLSEEKKSKLSNEDVNLINQLF